MREQHRHALVTLERRRPRQQLVGHARQRVLIGAPIHRQALDLLRRRISGVPTKCPAPVRLTEEIAPLLTPKSDKYT